MPPQLAAFEVDEVELGGEAWTVAIADTSRLRSQGLMEVTDLGALDGMLFVFAADTTTQFHMTDTLIPLDIAFFTAVGRLVSVTQMVPCPETPCPDYSAGGAYRYALEAPAGALFGIDPDVTLRIPNG